MTDRQVHPFNKSGVQASREAESLQGDLESGLCPQAHHMRDLDQLTPSVTFLYLAVDQARCYLPSTGLPPPMPYLEPVSKMSCQGIEVQIEAITGEERQTVLGQEPSQRVDEQVCHMLGTGTQMERGKNFRARVDGEPQPEHLFSAAETCAQLVQLEVWEVGGGRRSARVRSVRARQHGTERLVMVACRKPCDPLGVDASGEPPAGF